MNYKLYDNGQIMKVIAEGHEVAHTMNKQIRFVTGTAPINTQINISIIYEVFDLEQGEHITDTSINKDVKVYVNNELKGLETIVAGEGMIEFESAESGTFEIKIEGYKCEVIVNAN